MEKILVVNAGSSSLKFQLIDMPWDENVESPVVLFEGGFERIGIENPSVTYKYNGNKETVALTIDSHAGAVDVLKDLLIEKGIVKDLNEITGIGHRYVNGGPEYMQTTVLTEQVYEDLKKTIDFAPVHNFAHLKGIAGFTKALPNVLQAIVFDTSFHQTMPDEAYRYAVPKYWYDDYKIRKYGAHGTSHQYVSLEAARVLGKKPEELRVITAHIGNGASLAAVKYGKCVDTSMGFTPLAGIPMGTRSGDVDSSVLDMVYKKEGKNVHELITALNKESGYTGFTGHSDARDVRDLQASGNYEADLALRLQEKRIVDYISSYYGYMGGCDVLVFTAGIGEKSYKTREAVCERLHEAFGVELDYEANKACFGTQAIISKPESKIIVMVVPTNEELMIAREVMTQKKLHNR